MNISILFMYVENQLLSWPNYKIVLSLMPKASEIRLHFSYSSRRGQFSKLFFLGSLCCYIAQHFYSIVVLYSELPMQVMCSICIVLFTWNYNQTYNQKKGFLSILKKPRFDRNFKRSFSMKYSVIKIFQFNVDES